MSKKILNEESIRPRQSRFSIGSAPLTSITESDAQISGGETRQDYKDTRRFPLVAPSCALLFLPFGLPVSFRCYGRVYLIPRLTLSSGKAVRSKLDCMHEPPVQSDCCALSGNYRLESNPERHDKTPLAAATGKGCTRYYWCRVLELSAQLRLNWKDVFGGSGLVHPVTTVQKFPNLLNLRKTTSPGGFFVSGLKILCVPLNLKKLSLPSHWLNKKKPYNSLMGLNHFSDSSPWPKSLI